MSHTLTVEYPTVADLQNGGWGFVAQCSCGRYEFVVSSDEAGYWHWLHHTNPSATPFRLLSMLVDRPMPEGWAEPSETPAQPKPKPRTCANCLGLGSTEFYGTADGRFYQMGNRRTCETCEGAGMAQLTPA